MSFGRTVLGTAGGGLAVSADGSPEWKLGGITIDWSVVTAVSGADLTLADGTIVKIGDKYLRYGTVLYLDTGNNLWKPAASGTPATLKNGETVVLNNTRIKDSGGLNQSDNIGALEGGRVWQDRLLVGLSSTTTLALLKAACPRLQMVVN